MRHYVCTAKGYQNSHFVQRKTTNIKKHTIPFFVAFRTAAALCTTHRVAAAAASAAVELYATAAASSPTYKYNSKQQRQYNDERQAVGLHHTYIPVCENTTFGAAGSSIVETKKSSPSVVCSR